MVVRLKAAALSFANRLGVYEAVVTVAIRRPTSGRPFISTSDIPMRLVS